MSNFWYVLGGAVWLIGASAFAAFVKRDDPKEWENDPSLFLIAFWPIVIPITLAAMGPFALTTWLLEKHDGRKVQKKAEADELKKCVADLESELAEGKP
jgi:hypothetical protein